MYKYFDPIGFPKEIDCHQKLTFTDPTFKPADTPQKILENNSKPESLFHPEIFGISKDDKIVRTEIKHCSAHQTSSSSYTVKGLIEITTEKEVNPIHGHIRIEITEKPLNDEKVVSFLAYHNGALVVG